MLSLDDDSSLTPEEIQFAFRLVCANFNPTVEPLSSGHLRIEGLSLIWRLSFIGRFFRESLEIIALSLNLMMENEVSPRK